MAENDIHQVSLYVHWQDRDDREVDLPDFDAYYEHLRTAPELPTTSQPSVGDFLAVYEPLLDAGHDIVSIHLSARISGHARARRQAARRARRRGRRIEVVDSSTRLRRRWAWSCWPPPRPGARASDAGAVVAHAREARAALHMWFGVDTLEYLRRGGRIGAAQAWLGTALKIKPILTLEDEITPVERVRTSGRAFERMVDYLRSAPRRRRRRVGRPAHPGARPGRAARRARARDLRLRARVRVGGRAR